MKVGGVRKDLIVEVKSKGEPKYLLNAIGSLSLVTKQRPDAYPVVFVPSLTREARALLRQAEVGYITLRGEAFLKFDSVYIDKESGTADLEEMAETNLRALESPRRSRALKEQYQNILKEASETRRSRKTLDFPFSAKASRVVRALLEKPDMGWSISTLAKEARVAPRLALLVVNNLDAGGYVKKVPGNIRLAQRDALLDSWSALYRFEKANRLNFCYSLASDFEAFSAKLAALPDELRDGYRLTMFAGASLVAPYVRFNTIHLYVRSGLEDWLKRLDLERVESGANVVLAEPFDEGVFDYRQTKKGLSIVSNTQLYLDLFNLNDRAREQAGFLFKETLKRVTPGSLGERIKSARLARMGERGAMTQRGLADFLQVSPERVQAWEENAERPTDEQLQRLARWLRKPIGYFLTAGTEDARA
ncbi:MAG: helix-turn-helix domain-containing protein [Elusimicrobia bacterium]|nr:helix-turn-helix domain-containing protein [Elusimicrobiota bacterium]